MTELVALIRHEFSLSIKQKILMREKWAEVRLSDFNLWVAGMGVMAGKNASLDTRLQALPTELSTLRHLLSSLKKSLTDCRKLDENELEESMEIVDLIMENLATIATVIRRTGKRSRLRRADLTFDPQRQIRLRQFFECLIILRPTENALFRPKIPEDWTSVIPCIAEGEGQLSPLQMRLIDANLRRRYRFLCAQRHSEKLAGSRTPAKTQDTTKSHAGTSTTSVKEGGVSRSSDSTPANSQTFTKPVKELSLRTSSTKASTVETKYHSAEDKVHIPRAPQTKITAITATTQYPSPMKPHAEDLKEHKIFKCPCCCQPQPEIIAKNHNAFK